MPTTGRAKRLVGHKHGGVRGSVCVGSENETSIKENAQQLRSAGDADWFTEVGAPMFFAHLVLVIGWGYDLQQMGDVRGLHQLTCEAPMSNGTRPVMQSIIPAYLGSMVTKILV
jgi:hypothetical protein